MTEREITKADNVPPPLVSADQLAKDFAYLETELVALETAEIPPVLEDEDDLALVTKNGIDLIALRKKIETKRKDTSRPIIDAQNTVNDFFTRGLNARAEARQTAIEAIAKIYLKKKSNRERLAREKIAADALAAAQEAQRKVAEAAAAQTKETSVMPVLQAAERADALTAFANKTAGAAAAPLVDLSRSKTAAGSAGLTSFWTFEFTDYDKIDLNMLRQHVTVAAIEAAMRAFIKAGGRNITGARIYEDSDVNLRGKRG